MARVERVANLFERQVKTADGYEAVVLVRQGIGIGGQRERG